jgi:hypothetical protein
MQQDGSAGRHSRLLRNKPARSDGGSVANCRNLRDPQSALLQPMRGRPLNGHGKLQGDFPLHFPLSVTCESAGSCRQPPPVAAVRAISPGDFRSLARKKWEVRKNIPHRIWLRVGPQGYRNGLIKRLLILAASCGTMGVRRAEARLASREVPAATDTPECVKEVRSGKTHRHFTGRFFFSWEIKNWPKRGISGPILTIGYLHPPS